MKPDHTDILSILKFLHQKTIEDGGDGEAVWLTKFYELKDISYIIEHENIEPTWKIEINENYIRWFDDQEGIIITNNKNLYNSFISVELRLELH